VIELVEAHALRRGRLQRARNQSLAWLHGCTGFKASTGCLQRCLQLSTKNYFQLKFSDGKAAKL
jgi:hypothetical protein